MQVVPAILENNQEDFVKQIIRLQTKFSYFQIDIADGVFVPNKTIQVEEIIKLSTLNFKNLTLDFHLMVKDYEVLIKKLLWQKKINLKNIFIHYSLFPKYESLNAKYFPLTIGLVLNPKDEVLDLANQHNLKNIKVVQIMSVEPGFQGRSFIPKTLNKIEQLRKLGYRNKIYLDGGVNNKTIPIILKQKFQPDFICVGSFFKNHSLRCL